ncbi:hypothetical protein Poly51_34280 [Rubripirellula tenax]|nr:hypothetical protein Poly51_34280 [Rubripirellula tenax]
MRLLSSVCSVHAPLRGVNRMNQNKDDTMYDRNNRRKHRRNERQQINFTIQLNPADVDLLLRLFVFHSIANLVFVTVVFGFAVYFL